MADHEPNRAQLEEIWGARLKQSRTAYQFATAQFAKALSEQNQRLTPAPDGVLAVRQARLQETTARNEYMRVLRIFTELVVSGKPPTEV
jgi:hypothetical protein